MISTVNTLTRRLITRVSETITIALFASWKSPMIIHASVTFESLDFIIAITLARFQITKVIFRSRSITITRFQIYKKKR